MPYKKLRNIGKYTSEIGQGCSFLYRTVFTISHKGIGQKIQEAFDKHDELIDIWRVAVDVQEDLRKTKGIPIMLPDIIT